MVTVRVTYLHRWCGNKETSNIKRVILMLVMTYTMIRSGNKTVLEIV